MAPVGYKYLITFGKLHYVEYSFTIGSMCATNFSTVLVSEEKHAILFVWLLLLHSFIAFDLSMVDSIRITRW